jgi:hypothetical protein
MNKEQRTRVIDGGITLCWPSWRGMQVTKEPICRFILTVRDSHTASQPHWMLARDTHMATIPAHALPDVFAH